MGNNVQLLDSIGRQCDTKRAVHFEISCVMLELCSDRGDCAVVEELLINVQFAAHARNLAPI